MENSKKPKGRGKRKNPDETPPSKQPSEVRSKKTKRVDSEDQPDSNEESNEGQFGVSMDLLERFDTQSGRSKDGPVNIGDGDEDDEDEADVEEPAPRKKKRLHAAKSSEKVPYGKIETFEVRYASGSRSSASKTSNIVALSNKDETVKDEVYALVRILCGPGFPIQKGLQQILMVLFKFKLDIDNSSANALADRVVARDANSIGPKTNRWLVTIMQEVRDMLPATCSLTKLPTILQDEGFAARVADLRAPFFHRKKWDRYLLWHNKISPLLDQSQAVQGILDRMIWNTIVSCLLYLRAIPKAHQESTTWRQWSRRKEAKTLLTTKGLFDHDLLQQIEELCTIIVLAEDEEDMKKRLARFEKENRLANSLNVMMSNPNIMPTNWVSSSTLRNVLALRDGLAVEDVMLEIHDLIDEFCS